MVLKAELQKTLSALSAGRAKHSRSFGRSAGGQGHPPRPAALSGRSAGPGRGVHRGRARPPIAGPFLARHPGTRPLSPGRCPRRHPSPPLPDPGNFAPASPHLSAARRSCRPGGSSARPPSSPLGARSRPSPATGGQGTRERGAGAAAAAAGLHAHAFRGREEKTEKKKEKGARQGSSAPLRPGLARRQRLPPCRRLLPRRPTSPARRLIQPLPLAAAQGFAAGPLPSPCAPDPSTARRRRSPGAAAAARAHSPPSVPARWASQAPAGGRGKVFPGRIPMGFFPRAAEGVRRRRPTLGLAWSGLLSASRPVAARAALCAPGRGARWSCGARAVRCIGT